MNITVFICNSAAVHESVIREGEEREVLLEKQQFRLEKELKLKLYSAAEGLVIWLPEGVFCKDRTAAGPGKLSVSDNDMLLMEAAGCSHLYITVYFHNEYRVRRFSTEREKRISVGRAYTNTICAQGQRTLSCEHLVIEREGGKYLLDIRGRNGCYVNSVFKGAGEVCILHFSDEIILHGVKLLWLNDSLVLMHPGVPLFGDTGCTETAFDPVIVRLREIELYRPQTGCPGLMPDIRPIPRTVRRPDTAVVELDAPPHKQENRPESLMLTIGPAFTMALPMILGSGLAIYGNKIAGSEGNSAFVYTGLITAVSAALLGALWAVMNLRKRRSDEKRRERKRKRAYERYIRETEDRIRDRYDHNREILMCMYPEPSVLTGGFDTAYLWNRLKEDEDYLCVRLGTGNDPRGIRIEAPRERFCIENDRMLRLPAMLRDKYGVLREVPVLFDLGSGRLFGVIAQKEQELLELLYLMVIQLCFFISANRLKLAILLTGGSLSERDIRILRFLPQLHGRDMYYLGFTRDDAGKIRASLSELLSDEGGQDEAGTCIVFSDDYNNVKELLRDHNSLKAVLLGCDYSCLPGECSMIVRRDPEFQGIINTRDLARSREVIFDRVDTASMEWPVRRLSGIRVSEETVHLPVPERVLLEEIFGMPIQSFGSFIIKNWQENDTIHDLRIPVGIGRDNEIVCLDPHENCHGPHGLVAGMTGSGKSEMLQTIIIALSVRFSPQRVNFFLIDYKGGGMAELFKGLPHLSGSISNLSGNNIRRAMVAVRSENERRQKLFLEAGVNRITEYEKKYLKHEVLEALPHIFIVIDEFAELKKNEPDFMRELVSVAQVGRSLGIHLILATQKPQGTVDDNIWSNSRFRICLRVQDRQDSVYMLHRPDAAFLKGVGRAVLQVGNDDVYEEFQCAYTMAARGSPGGSEKIAFLDRLGREVRDDTGNEKGYREKEVRVSDFEVIKAFLSSAAGISDMPPARKLWMRELPAELEISRAFSSDPYTYCLGTYDAPRRQKQGDLTINLINGGHHIILGRSGSGKSTLLQTLLYNFLIHETPSGLNAYILDYGNGMLSTFKESLLVGACFTEEDSGSIKNLFYMLKKEMQRRKTLFCGINFASALSLPEKVPAIVLIIDNYGTFRQKTKEGFDGDIQELAKSGEAYGIYLILTGGQIGPSDIPGRIHELVKTVICLSLPDRMNYSQSLRVLRCEVFPEEGIAGRGIAFMDGELLEFQTGLSYLTDEYSRNIRLKELIAKRNEDYKGHRAKKVPVVPAKPVFSDLARAFFEDEELAGKRDHILPAGFMLSGGEPFVLPLNRISSFIISGRRRSGKSNMLKLIAEAAGLCGLEAVMVRKMEELREGLLRKEKGLIMIGYPGKLSESFYSHGFDPGAEEELTELLAENRKTRLHNIIMELNREDEALIAGRRIFDGIKEEAYGVHLGGMINDQNLFEFSELTFSQKNVSKKPGEGDVPDIGEELYSGEVRIPLWEQTDQEMNLC